jgi:hypothetical protein
MDATNMVSIVCGKCGIEFHVPKRWQTDRRESKETFWCPNGHPRVYCESEADVIRRERDRLKQQIAERDDAIRREQNWRRAERDGREAAERRASAARGQVTRLKNRASAGVCPCCNRTFSQLARHMAEKHPRFKAEAVAGDNVIPLPSQAGGA